MFTTVPAMIDTTNLSQRCYGKGTKTKIETITPFRSREIALLNDYLSNWRDEKRTELYNVIGSTNLVIVDDHLIVSEKTLFELMGRVVYKDDNSYIDFWLQQILNPKLRGYKKYGNDLYLRPILITKTDKVCDGSDILGIAGFQLLSRNNTQHNGLKPLMVRGVKHAKKVI